MRVTADGADDPMAPYPPNTAAARKGRPDGSVPTMTDDPMGVPDHGRHPMSEYPTR
jgi:hypothetical protein